MRIFEFFFAVPTLRYRPPYKNLFNLRMHRAAKSCECRV